MIDVLKTIAGAIGYPGVEVFPKQAKRPSGGYGNYINLPFFGHPSLEYACYTPQEVIGLSGFLDLAEWSSTTTADLNRLVSQQKLTSYIQPAENSSFSDRKLVVENSYSTLAQIL